MKAFLICCFVVLCAYSFYGVQGCGTTYTTTTYIGWRTTFGNSFERECDSGKSLYNIQSTHNDQKEDRVWYYECHDNKYITTSCKWSHYINAYDGNVNFICPGEGYMVGMSAGSHDSHYNDRRFKFKCCDSKPGQGQAGCKWTSYVNTWDGKMNFKVGRDDNFIAGAFSTHHDHYEDRRWKFYICL